MLLNERHTLGETAFMELVVWRSPKRVPGCTHLFKYRLALVVEGRCVLRYDNEAGKGDHKHVTEAEQPYAFTTLDQLLVRFPRRC